MYKSWTAKGANLEDLHAAAPDQNMNENVFVT